MLRGVAAKREILGCALPIPFGNIGVMHMYGMYVCKYGYSSLLGPAELRARVGRDVSRSSGSYQMLI